MMAPGKAAWNPDRQDSGYPPITHSTRSLTGMLLLMFAILIGASGCDTASLDFKEAMNWDIPSPTQATQWMFNRDPEKRREGLSLVSNAPWGGEEVYVKVYRAAINDLDPIVRAESIRALGMHGQATDAQLVAGKLTDLSQLVRWNAAHALQRLHDPAVAPALIRAMTDDEDNDVRMDAADALGQYRNKTVVEALIGALDDPSVAVNIHAARALRTLTGQNLGLDSGRWLAWYRSTDQPFAGAREYYYPVYSRQLSFLEQILPFSKKHFESPGIPVGASNAHTGAAPDDHNGESTAPN